MSIVVYMAGGPDSSLFRLENEGSGNFDDIPFPVVSYIFWIIFIVIMSILFINFLVRSESLIVHVVNHVHADAMI